MKTKNVNKKKKLISEIVKVVALLILGVIMMTPFIWMLSVSFERMANVQPPFPPRLIPKEFSFFNYKIILENGSLLRAYMNSGIIAFGTVALNVFSALLAGYAFSKGVFKGKKNTVCHYISNHDDTKRNNINPYVYDV